MIDQSVLVAAFHAWTRDKSRSIAEILLVQGAIDADDRALLEGLATKHLKRHGDDVEKRVASVPALRPVVTGLVATGDVDVIATLGHAASVPRSTLTDGGPKPELTDGGPEADATASMGRLPGDGQRVRAAPHASGGLGAVFVALDAELNREVCAQADPRPFTPMTPAAAPDSC